MRIIERFLTKNPCYTAGRKITVRGLMLHSVGCPQPNAQVFVRSWNRADFRDACVHAFIDGGTGEVYQTLPWDHRAWHASGAANNTHIGVELCEPATLKYTGGANFFVRDRADAVSCARRTYNAAVELFAYLCRKFDLDPTADGVILSHKEAHARGLASNHGDPEHLWTQLAMDCTMNGFRRDVRAAMEAAEPESEPVTMKLRLLSRGMRGRDVRAAMLLMRDRGYYPSEIPDDDDQFGPKMQAGLLRMQQEHGLGADGLLGVKSWGYLLK